MLPLSGYIYTIIEFLKLFVFVDNCTNTSRANRTTTFPNRNSDLPPPDEGFKTFINVKTDCSHIIRVIQKRYQIVITKLAVALVGLKSVKMY